MEIITFFKYFKRPKPPTPFSFRHYEKKENSMSNEMADYIKKSNKESIERIVSQYKNFKGLLPCVTNDNTTTTMNPFFSLPNRIFYLGLFTGSCLFLIWKRQK